MGSDLGLCWGISLWRMCSSAARYGGMAFVDVIDSMSIPVNNRWSELNTSKKPLRSD